MGRLGCDADQILQTETLRIVTPAPHRPRQCFNHHDSPIVSVCQLLYGCDVADQLIVNAMTVEHHLDDLGATEHSVTARFSFAPQLRECQADGLRLSYLRSEHSTGAVLFSRLVQSTLHIL